ncbi:MAG: MmcQ/YjbR family DNA-binding protein [Bacteroidota bacterium]
MSVSLDTYRKIVLAFPEVTEEQHFGYTAFKISKKVFATLNPPENRGCFKLSSEDQSIFCSFGPAIYPVPERWAKFGWTNVSLPDVKEEILAEALKAAFCEVAPKRLSKLFAYNGEEL